MTTIHSSRMGELAAAAAAPENLDRDITRSLARVIASLTVERDLLASQVTRLQERENQHVAERRATLRSQVREFHATFGVPLPERPAVPSDERVRLRLRLIAEEFFETLSSAINGDSFAAAKTAGVSSIVGLCATDGEVLTLAETVVRQLIDRAELDVDIVSLCDGIADSMFVLEGTFSELGVDSGPVLAEVAASNLSKWPSTVDSTGKIQKSAAYKPPCIDAVLAAQGWHGDAKETA